MHPRCCRQQRNTLQPRQHTGVTKRSSALRADVLCDVQSRWCQNDSALFALSVNITLIDTNRQQGPRLSNLVGKQVEKEQRVTKACRQICPPRCGLLILQADLIHRECRSACDASVVDVIYMCSTAGPNFLADHRVARRKAPALHAWNTLCRSSVHASKPVRVPPTQQLVFVAVLIPSFTCREMSAMPMHVSCTHQSNALECQASMPGSHGPEQNTSARMFARAPEQTQAMLHFRTLTLSGTRTGLLTRKQACCSQHAGIPLDMHATMHRPCMRKNLSPRQKSHQSSLPELRSVS